MFEIKNFNILVCIIIKQNKFSNSVLFQLLFQILFISDVPSTTIFLRAESNNLTNKRNIWIADFYTNSYF